MGFWDLISYGLTVQLIITVSTHVRRIIKFNSLFTVLLCYCLSTFFHLVHVSLMSYLGQHDEHYYDSSSSSSSGRDQAELVFPLSPLSISLLAFTFLLLIYVVEAITWCQTSFVPLLRSIKYFYHKLNRQKRKVEASIDVQPPGIDLRGKILKNQ